MVDGLIYACEKKWGTLSSSSSIGSFGYVIKGSWRYLEHDWVAEEGGFVYEPPGKFIR